MGGGARDNFIVFQDCGLTKPLNKHDWTKYDLTNQKQNKQFSFTNKDLNPPKITLFVRLNIALLSRLQFLFQSFFYHEIVYGITFFLTLLKV